MENIERRAFIKGAVMGALAFTVGGGEVLLTPRDARSQGVPFRTLTAEQVEALEALGETLVPGARQAGISHFVDQQLSIPAEQALLEARILNVRPPFADFYRTALGAIDRASQARAMAGASRSSMRASGASSWMPCVRTRSTAGRVRPGGSSTSCSATMPSMWSTEPWMAMPPLAFPTCRISRQRRDGDHGYERKSRCRHRRRRRIGLSLRRSAGE